MKKELMAMSVLTLALSTAFTSNCHAVDSHAASSVADTSNNSPVTSVVDFNAESPATSSTTVPLVNQVGVAGNDSDQLPEVFVTATRNEQAMEAVNASVQAIGRKEIQKFSGRSITEVLQYATSVYVKDSGSSSSVSIRGFDSSQTLVLVDGLKRTEKYTGTNLNNIQLEDIERIEIVRGPMSALYGADALGGIVNIITRKPQGKTEYGVHASYGQTGGGQRDSFILGGFANFGTQSLAHRFSFEAKRREPYTLSTSNQRTTDLNREKRTFAGYQGSTQTASGKLNWGVELANQNDDGRGLTAALVPYQKIENEDRYNILAGYKQEISDGVMELKGSFGRSDASVNRGTAVNETTLFKETQIEGQYTFEPLSQNIATAGYAYRRDDADISTNTSKALRNVNAVFAQDQWKFAQAWDMTIGIRQDRYSDFGNKTTPRLALAWQQGDLILRGGYGKGFKAPSLLTMYMKSIRRGQFLIRGNPNLKPEESASSELAATYLLTRGRVEVVAHSSDIKNLIVSYRNGSCGPGCTYSDYKNEDQVKIKGVETALIWQGTDAIRFDGGVDYLDAFNAITKARLADRARWGARAGTHYSGAEWNGDLRLRYVRDFYAANPLVTGGASYNSSNTIISLRVGYGLSKSTEMFAGIDNLFDRAVPINMSSRGAPDDPGARYFYLGLSAKL